MKAMLLAYEEIREHEEQEQLQLLAGVAATKLG